MHLFEQLLVGTTFILVFVIVTNVLLLDQPFQNKPSILIFCLILVIMTIVITCKWKKPVAEGFSSNFDSTQSINKIFSLLGIQDAMNSTTNAVTSTNVLTNDYNEILQSIVPGLVLYYSAFSKSSYPKPSLYWYNISPFFTEPDKSCPEVRIDDTHMRFLMEPSYTRDSGFSLVSNSIVGPKCHQLAIKGDDAFTIFMTIRFDTFITKENIKTKSGINRTTVTGESNNIIEDLSSYELFKLYANTINNMGVTVYIDDNIEPLGTTVGVNIVCEYGSQPPIVATDPNLGLSNSMIYINPTHTYMFVLVKKQTRIALHMFPNIDNIAMNKQSKITLLDQEIDVHESVLLSNKNLVINRNKNIAGQVFNFGIYNKALEESELSLLFIHTQTELHKTNKLLVDLAAQITNLKSQMDKSKMCPYNTPVCKVCDTIKDWTSISSIITQADEDCLAQIDTYCTANPKHEHCVCWNPQNALSQTQQCKNYVNIFKNNKVITPDSIDTDTLALIKRNNNLCSCADIELLKQFVKDLKDQEKNKITIPKPPQLSTEYKIDPDALAFYESGNLDNYITKESKMKIDDRYLVKDPFDTNPKTPKVTAAAPASFFDKLFN